MYISLDIGGTKCMAAAFSDSLEIVARERADTPRNLSEGLELLTSLTRKVASGSRIRAIGASAGGPLDHASGVVSPLHMPEWHNVPLKQIFQDTFGAPFFVDVDTNTAALAEYRFGGHSVQRLLYVTLSTGMGGGFIVDGEIYRGFNNNHPEIAHQTIPYQLPVAGPIQCACGALDCLEAVVCGTAIQKIYGKPATALSAQEWDQVAYNLGQGLRNAAMLYAPEVIVLGGGMALGGGDRLLSGIHQVLEQNMKIVPRPTVSLSTLGYDTALWGGLALILHSDQGWHEMVSV